MKFAEFFKKVMAVKAYATPRTRSQDPLQGFMFQLAIPGIDSTVGFQAVQGFSREIEVIEYFESTFQHAYKLPGRETFSEITLTRGMYPEGDPLREKYESCFTNTEDFRDEVTLYIKDRAGTIRKTYRFAEAWFSSYTPGDLDSTSSDVIIESLVMQYEYILPNQPGE